MNAALPKTALGPLPLRCDGLTWRRNGATVLDGVTLDVRPGEKLGIIGPNGSGKSSLLRLLAGLAAPDAGAVWLGERLMGRFSRRQVAQAMALVQQHSHAAERIRVFDAVALGRTPWLSSSRPWGIEDDQVVAQALEVVGMAGFAQRWWHSLSGGERQRVQLARALAQQPQVLLLDEPSNHLDIAQQLALLELIGRLPVTLLLALHDLNHALYCDRLAILDHGRLVAAGPPRKVLTQACLAETFGVAGHWLHDPMDQRDLLVLRPL